MRYVALIIIFLIASAGQAQDEERTSPQILVKVPLGETVSVEGIEIIFHGVIEDSRCPKNVTCVWEGRAIVDVTARTDDELVEGNRVILGKSRLKPGYAYRIYETEDLIMEVVDLSPYPEAGVEQEPYYLLVRCFQKSQ